MSVPVAVILVWAPALPRPYPLIPAEDYCFCRSCNSVVLLVNKAIDAHALVREAGRWTRAIVVTNDGRGLDVKPHKGEAMALA